MKYAQLNMSKQRKARRKGRGISAGQGKNAGRGTKGQGSRKSGGVRPGFEGGQMPLYMRLPHLRGFKSSRPKAETVTTGAVNMIKGAHVEATSLYEAGIISNPHNYVKLVVKGDITEKKDVKLSGASAAAIKMVEKAGGKFTPVGRLARQAKVKAEKSQP